MLKYRFINCFIIPNNGIILHINEIVKINKLQCTKNVCAVRSGVTLRNLLTKRLHTRVAHVSVSELY